MREMHISDPDTVHAVIDTLRHDVVMLQMPTVFTLLAPPNSAGVERLDRAKDLGGRQNYGTVHGDLESFYDGALPPRCPRNSTVWSD